MVINPRLITLIGGLFGGGFGLVPLFSWNWSDKNTNLVKTNLSPLSSPVKPSVALSAPVSNTSPKQEERIKNIGNCLVRESLHELVTEVWNLGLNPEYYITIYCENNTNSKIEKELSKEWTGLFPKTLISRGWSLGPRTKFDIEIETEAINKNSYRITFSGNGIQYSPMTGEWEEKSNKTIGGSIKVITVTSPSIATSSEKIYIKFK